MLSHFNRIFNSGRVVKSMLLIAMPNVLFIICFFTSGVFWQAQNSSSVRNWTLVTNVAPFSWGVIGYSIWFVLILWSIISSFLFTILSVLFIITLFARGNQSSLRLRYQYFLVWIGMIVVYWAILSNPIANWISWPLD